MKTDAAAALRFYGETLDIRRPSLKHLGPEVQVRRVRLVYEGGKLMPGQEILKDALKDVRANAQGVEVECNEGVLTSIACRRATRSTSALRAPFNSDAPLERELEPFLEALEAYADGWMPDVTRGKRRRNYSRAAVWKALAERHDGRSTGPGLYRTKAPALYVNLWLGPSTRLTRRGWSEAPVLLRGEGTEPQPRRVGPRVGSPAIP